MTKNYLSQADMVALADAIRQVCHKDEEGFAVYDEGWSDQRFVDESKGRVTLYNVRGLRESLVGQIAKGAMRDSNADLAKRLRKLEAWAARRPVEPFKL